MTELLLLLISVVLVLACGAFVAAEFAFITADRSTVERSADAGDARSAGLLIALRTLSTQLSGAQLGITVTNLAIGFLAEQAIATLLEGPLTSAGLPSGAVPSFAVTVALILATAVTMIYGELVPKGLAIARPQQVGRAVQGFQRRFTRVAAWPIRLLNGSANVVLRWFGIEPQEELASARSAEELFSLLERSAEQGTLAEETADLLQRSLAFGDKRAGDVLTPRVDMHVADGDASVATVIALTMRTGHSRFPVTGEDLDDIIGMIDVKHAVSVEESQRDQVLVRNVMVEARVVPSSLHLDPLMESMRDGGLQMAVVLDEYGGVDGLVTVEDLIEELVGDVNDEHDRHSTPIRRLSARRWLISGQLRPDEVTDETDVEIPEGRSYETIAGLIAKHLGRIPEVGDTVEFDSAGVPARLTVRRMVVRRVDRVLLETGTDQHFSGEAGQHFSGEANPLGPESMS